MAPEWMEGSPRPFSKVLVANRGEIAVRILRAARESGLVGVALYSDSDASSLHVEVADEAVRIDGETLEQTYLNGTAIIEAAKSCEADAIHPGYGFLSERADFAREVESSGILWIGPPAEAIETMGDKISARRLMIDSGVPVIPGEEVPVEDGADHLGNLAISAARVGYPLLLKASAGGGGKGMRAVSEPKSLRSEYEAAAREASAAFGDGTVYVERLLRNAKHVEIQVLCDSHGNAVHLNERDCSLQRRYQKVIEEAPSPAVSGSKREEMGKAAVTAAMSVGYVGAGTVEFLLATNGDFYFLEMNTRLQVEHGVSEMATGVDLVCEQLRVAAGERLRHSQADIAPAGHVIECRINAEDPTDGFRPSPGTISRWQVPDGDPDIRVDTHVREGYTVPPHYDSLLCKLLVRGADRDAACDKMIEALGQFACEGVPTTAAMHLAIMRSDAFRNCDYDTSAIPGWPAS